MRPVAFIFDCDHNKKYFILQPRTQYTSTYPNTNSIR